jgi:alanine-synthesizing transaminase
MAKTGIFPTASRRVPRDTEPNAWARRLAERRAGEILDLMEMNPACAGLHALDDETEFREALADPGSASQSPDARGLRIAREAVAGYYSDRGVQLDPDRVVITSGTSESYAHLFRLLADPGDRVLVPAPSYPLFEPIARLEGIEVETYRLAYDGAWHLDIPSVEAAFSRGGSPARAIVVVQPNLPTGSCLSDAEVRTIEDACARHGAAILSDEVFLDFPWPGTGEERLPSLLGPRQVPTFVLGGLSKACGLPHLKLGWIAATGPPETDRLLEGLEWIADLFLSVGMPIQLAAPRLLAMRGRFQQRVRARMAEDLAILRGIGGEGSEARVLEARGGWAAILRMPARRSGEEWALALLDRGVAVHPDHFYDVEIPSLVLSTIVPPETLREGMGHLAQLLTTA